MAGEIPDLHAEVRTGTGKGAARQVRRENYVPGIVYGGDQPPLPIKLPYNALLKKLKEGRFLATLFNLKIEGQDDVRVICRKVERHVVKDLPTHVDLMRLRRTSRITLDIPVEIVGHDACPGLKRGGVLEIIRPQIELEVTAGDIPEHIVLDISEAKVGDTLHISDIKLPEGVKPTIERNFVIANLQAPSTLGGGDAD